MNKAVKINTAIFGTLAGLAGIEHGVGEILQGSTAPEGVVFASWPHSAAFEVVSGEPAMSILPNLLATGVLAILFSLVYIAWAVLFAQRARGSGRGGLALMLLCVPMLLFGAGFGPPLLGLIIGAAAARAQARPDTRRAPRTGGPRSWLGRLWPWSLGACLAAWLAMMPGTMLLNHFWGVNNTDLVLGLVVAMFSLLGLTILTASAQIDDNACHEQRDLQNAAGNEA